MLSSNINNDCKYKTQSVFPKYSEIAYRPQTEESSPIKHIETENSFLDRLA